MLFGASSNEDTDGAFAVGEPGPGPIKAVPAKYGTGVCSGLCLRSQNRKTNSVTIRARQSEWDLSCRVYPREECIDRQVA